MQDSLTPLQVLGLRWVMLQAVFAGSILGSTEQMCWDAARAAYPAAGLERVRAELDYLESASLIVLKRSQVKPWTAKLTQAGRDVVDYVVDEPEGILRPLRQTWRG